jgi:hypothetical protein
VPCIEAPFVEFCLSTENVDNGEDDNPDGVDEVPVERENFEATRVFTGQRASKRKIQREREHEETDDDMARVKADK